MAFKGLKLYGVTTTFIFSNCLKRGIMPFLSIPGIGIGSIRSSYRYPSVSIPFSLSNAAITGSKCLV
jgi:hypothetical protein